jgi:hypothetical protein
MRTPSDSPTGIQFVPGLEALVLSDQGKTRVADAVRPKKSRAGLGFLVVLVVLVAGVVGAVIVTAVMEQSGDSPSDAGGVAVVEVAADATVTIVAATDAALVDEATDAVTANAAVTADAAVAVAREVVLTVNVPTAQIEVDGAIVSSANGIAKLSLTDGPHRVKISAARRTTVEQTLQVSEVQRTFDVKLERDGRKPATTTTKPKPTSGTGSGSAKPTVRDPNAPIDPF